jgi:hypothetical protein
MHHHRRLPALALSATLLLAMAPSSTASAAVAATFSAPTGGVISVLPGTSYRATWVETAGLEITSRTIALQTARPMGARGCDNRWAPVLTTPIEGNSLTVSDLGENRCYRFLLALDTAAGRQIIASAPIIPAPAGFAATATFTNPITDGLVTYETSTSVSWAERDTLGLGIVSRGLARQSAGAIDGACTGASWSDWVGLTFSGQSISQTLAPSSCYRYRLTLQDSAGYRSEITSGAIAVAAGIPPWTGMLDLYRSDAFASQANSTLCVAAGTQMMLNVILGRTDTSGDAQLAYITYAQANDAGNHSTGSDPAGWAAALNRYGGGGYRVAVYADRTAALKAAATRMRLSNKPVGMLVWAGRHAWVMSGFAATADPAATSSFSVTSVFVEGPLYPRPPNAWGYDLPPDAQLTPAQLAQYFTKYSDGYYAWNGTFVLILP